MRRFASPVLILVSAASLFLGACSKDSSSDTTVAVDTSVEADTTAATDTTAADTVAADTVAADDTAAVDDTTAEDPEAGVIALLGAIGVEADASTIECIKKDAPDLTTAVGDNGPSAEFLRGMINCVPEQLTAATAKAIVAKNSEVTEEQSVCIAKAYYKVLGSKEAEEFKTLADLPDTADFPQATKDEIAAGAADCGLDGAGLTKVLNTK